MKFSPLPFALSAGILWGAAVMLGTWFLLITGAAGGTIITLQNFYFGYSYSFAGGIIGLLWGFVDGFICGYLFVLLHNLFIKEKA